ncbi:MAG TPA: HNH endonuclease signature motif containing protein [Crocinitomicaceae bacterium]|nr:HNH endonuclease signature motif containing protein [Crocinitomicaceae bacterium]
MRKFWTAEEDAIMRSVYATQPTADIAKSLNRTERSVFMRADTLGLKKDAVYLQQQRKELVRQNFLIAGAATRFQKGNISHNKGKKMSPEMYAKVQKNMFKKGDKPKNIKPVGTIREWTETHSKRLYKYIKIAEPNVWQLLSHKVWIEANGPIPNGYRLHFKNGDTLNCELSNLELITDQEAMDRNRITHYPPELQQVIKLKNQLNKKIKNHGKKQNGGLA